MEKPINLSNPLSVWKNQSGVDVLLTEKQGGWLAQAETENCPGVKILSKDGCLFLKMPFLFMCFSHGFQIKTNTEITGF